MYNWNKIFSENEYQYLLKNTQDYSKKNTKQIIFASDALLDDYVDTFGLSKQLKKYNKLRLQSAKLKVKYLTESTRYLINQIEAIDNQIRDLKTLLFSGEKNDFDKQLVLIQKWYGQKIDLRLTSVKEFHVIQMQYVASNKQERNSRRGGTR